MKPKVFIVVPTIRSLSFLSEWKEEFQGTNLIVVEDHKTQEIETPQRGFQEIFHYTWEDIKGDFGKDEWVFSRKNAGIRSYGFWKAYSLGADITITMDDDCFPVDKDFVNQHTLNLNTKAPEQWFPSFPDRRFIYTRGFPYDIRGKRNVVISHGLWTNKIDLDGITQKKHQNINISPYPSIMQFIPPGQYFPMCSMNLAFTREATPLMYFPLMGSTPEGKSWGYDRFDDIWAGIFAKKICDHLGLSIINGSPFVEHRKASDPDINIKKEATGLKENEEIWKRVDSVNLTKKTPVACYNELAQTIQFPKTQYFIKLRRAMRCWASLFKI
jgi:reversibly glycosylated polypeptide / UDP-arabinopyranose mutase